MYEFIALMSAEHVKTIRNIAAFVYSSFQRIRYLIIVLSLRTCMYNMNCKMLKDYMYV